MTGGSCATTVTEEFAALADAIEQGRGCAACPCFRHMMNRPASDEALREFTDQTGFELPPQLLELYRLHDGGSPGEEHGRRCMRAREVQAAGGDVRADPEWRGTQGAPARGLEHTPRLARLGKLSPSKPCDASDDDRPIDADSEDEDGPAACPFSFSPLWHAALDCKTDDAAADSDCVPTSSPPGAIKLLVWNAKWLSIWNDGAGDHIAVDLDPGPNGQVGQMICCGTHDCTDMCVLGSSVADFLRNARRCIEAGRAGGHLVHGMRPMLYPERVQSGL